MHQEADIRQMNELKFMSRLSAKPYLLPVQFYLCSAYKGGDTLTQCSV